VMAPPLGWRTVPVSAGVMAYLAPGAEIPVALPDALADSAASDRLTNSADADHFASSSSIDGTRRPYVTVVSPADLEAVAPGRFVWQGVWQGEGYERVLDHQGQLVSPREGGADLHLNLVWDQTITDSTQPNLTITVQSNQDQSAQLTNLSAFRNDPDTNQTLRKDLGQLPPIYRVTLDSSGWLIPQSTKTLQPLGIVTFSYHIPPAKLKQHLPITLKAVNQLFEQRLSEISELEAAGWEIKEVPPPM
jgi:hypothetical protein